MTKNNDIAARLRDITTKVRNGVIAKEEALRLATLAMQEVDPADAVGEGEEEVDTQGENPPKEAPKEKPLPVDPKSRILALLTQLDLGYQSAWNRFESAVNSLFAETTGAATPSGEYSIGSDEGGTGRSRANQHQHKLIIEAGDAPNEAKVTYSQKKEWKIPNVTIPVTGGVEPSCNIALRKELLAVAEDIQDATTEGELSWRKTRMPLDKFAKIESKAKETNDVRVMDMMAGRPKDLTSQSWNRWAVSAHVYLLGGDYTSEKGKKFSDL